MTKYTFKFSGIATKTDKIRGIVVGDFDIHVVLAPTEEAARAICSLDEPVHLMQVCECNKDW